MLICAFGDADCRAFRDLKFGLSRRGDFLFLPQALLQYRTGGSYITSNDVFELIERQFRNIEGVPKHVYSL